MCIDIFQSGEKFALYRCAGMSAAKDKVQAVNRELLRRIFYFFIIFFITCFSLLLFAQIVLQDEISPEMVEEESKTTKSKGKL